MHAPLDKKVQSRLIKSVTLNVMLSVILGCFLGFYVYDGYASIDLKVNELNDMIRSFNAMKTDGIDGRKYQALVSKLGNSKRNKDEKMDFDKITAALKKPQNGPDQYMDWVKSEVAKEDDYDHIIDNNNRIIGNILPTFSDAPDSSDDAFSKNRITLRSFIKYVEENMLKKYNLESYSTLGLDNISFSTSQVGAVNIGSYKIDLDVSGTNASILGLLDSIQNSGKLPLKDGKLVDDLTLKADTTMQASQADSALSNLLITIESAKFETPPDHSDTKNKGQLTLVFYVRGRSYGDFVEIRNQLVSSVKDLKKDIETNGGLCKNGETPLCKNEIAFAAVNAIKELQDDISAIDKKLQDSAKNTNIQDISAEFDNLYGILTTYNAINAIYQKNLADINSVQRANAAIGTKSADSGSGSSN